MKIIFLDIDGVLNHDDWYVSKKFAQLSTADDVELDVDPRCAQRIIDICSQCNAKIVISSSWRLNMHGTIKRLEKGGIPQELIIGSTPVFTFISSPNLDRSRGGEIEAYLSQCGDVTNYAIIDDRSDFHPHQHPHLIHINPKCGLTDKDTKIAIQILNS